MIVKTKHEVKKLYHDNGAYVGYFMYDETWRNYNFIMENDSGLSKGYLIDIYKIMKKLDHEVAK